jgi:hypothetical protein
MSAGTNSNLVRLNQRLEKPRKEHSVVFHLIALGIAVVFVVQLPLIEWVFR